MKSLHIQLLFNKKLIEAEAIMLDVHERGKGIAGIYSYDIAITKVSTAMSMAKEKGFPIGEVAH